MNQALTLSFVALVLQSLALSEVAIAVDEADWSILENLLSANASIFRTSAESYQSSCETLGTNAYAISAGGQGICMHSHACQYEFCHANTERSNFDIPLISIDVRTESDVSNVFKFVNDTELLSPSSEYSSISVKTTGHSYQGSSTAKDSIMIWMHNFEKDGSITKDYASKLKERDIVIRSSCHTFEEKEKKLPLQFHFTNI